MWITNWYFSNQDPVAGAGAHQVSVQSRAQAPVRPFPCISLCETRSPRLPSSWGRSYCCIHHSWSRTLGLGFSTTVQKPVSLSCFFCTLLANVFITVTKFKRPCALSWDKLYQLYQQPSATLWLYIKRKVYLLTVVVYSASTKYRLKLITELHSSWII